MTDAITARFFEDFDESGLLTAVGLYDEDVAADEAPPSEATGQETAPGSTPENSRADPARLYELVVRRERRTYGQRRTRTPDRNDRGEALLEVDHIERLTDGGRDYPVQMIALCPDCHRVKTHGQSRHQLIPVLAQRARELHDQWMTAHD